MPGSNAAARRGRRIGAVGGIDLVVTAGGVLMSLAVAIAVVPGGPTRAWEWGTGVLWVGVLALLVAGSVFGHELGHALVARRHGLDVDRVSLSFIGGATEIVAPMDRPRTELRIAVAGPAASLAAATVLTGAAWLGDRAGVAGWPRSLALLALWNLVIVVVNLVPLPPLDGGHVVSAWRRGRRTVDRCGEEATS